MMSVALGVAVSLFVFAVGWYLRAGQTPLPKASVNRDSQQRDGDSGLMAAIRRRLETSFVVIRKLDQDWQNGIILSVLSFGFTAMLSLKYAIFVALLVLTYPPLAHRSRLKAREKQIQRELPIVCEMLCLCVSSGLNIFAALSHVAAFSNGPIAAEFRDSVGRCSQGHRLADSLEVAEAHLGVTTRPLTSALISAERFGASLAASLTRVADETRRAQDRRAEQAGQKLALQLLLPLAVTTLPAFAAFTVPPFVASAISSLAIPK